MSAGFNKTLKLMTPIIIRRSFQPSLVGLDKVGSIGMADRLFSEVYTVQESDGTLILADGQTRQNIFTTNRTCTAIEFTVYV